MTLEPLVEEPSASSPKFTLLPLHASNLGPGRIGVLNIAGTSSHSVPRSLTRPPSYSPATSYPPAPVAGSTASGAPAPGPGGWGGPAGSPGAGPGGRGPALPPLAAPGGAEVAGGQAWLQVAPPEVTPFPRVWHPAPHPKQQQGEAAASPQGALGGAWGGLLPQGPGEGGPPGSQGHRPWSHPGPLPGGGKGGGLLGGGRRHKPVFEDLLEATCKSFAAGLGEAQLQAVGAWAHPGLQERLLAGPLGPEALKLRHGLREDAALRLYRTLYLYSLGFCAALLEPTEGAREREALLEKVFAVYAQLWDEALGISFPSELQSALRTKSEAVAALSELSQELESSRGECRQLQERLNQFVRGNIDHMLAWRMMQDKAATTEGEVAMLASAAEVLGVKLAGADLEKEGRALAVEAAADRLGLAQERVTELQGQVVRLKRALTEQQALTVQHANKAKAAEAKLVQLATASQRSELSGIPSSADSNAEACAASASGPEVAQQLAQKSMAYALLHADFQVKAHDLDMLRERNSELERQVQEMHFTYQTATQQISQARMDSDRFKAKWEQSVQQNKELQATNVKLSGRNTELVRSYWPFLARVRELEVGNALLSRTAAEADSTQARLQAQIELLQQAAQEGESARLRLQALQKEVVAAGADLLPPSAAKLLPPEDAAHVGSAGGLQSLLYGAKERVASVMEQLMRLVDLQAKSGLQLQQSQASERELRRKVDALEEALQAMHSQQARSEAVDALDAPVGQKAGGPGGGLAQVQALKKELQDSRAQGSSLRAQLRAAQAEAEELLQQLEQRKAVLDTRDRWMRALSSHCLKAAAACDSLLRRDPAAPRPLLLPGTPSAPPTPSPPL
ncbi:hypothetical protein V8C86DRAFT_3024605, partial [Haematococcus lacustris]